MAVLPEEARQVVVDTVDPRFAARAMTEKRMVFTQRIRREH